MSKNESYAGLDVHKDSIQIALFLPGQSSPIEWKASTETSGFKRLVKRLKKESPGKVNACYEAGFCGFDLQRRLRKEGINCIVVAPSLIPKKAGDHVKTDRKDARKLGDYLRAGLLTEVHPPNPEQEAARDLCRCRKSAKEELKKLRYQLIHMLLRKGYIYQGTYWTYVHWRWLKQLKLSHLYEQQALENYLAAITQAEERVKDLDSKLEDLSQTKAFKQFVGWLCCFRGIDTLTAIILLTELHDFRRFNSPRQLMAYLGLVPGERSSADSVKRGGITKAGNRYVRSTLIESSFQYRHRPITSIALKKRRKGQPSWAIAIADKAAVRLNRRFNYFRIRRGMSYQKSITAVARELVGFIWAVFNHPLALETI